MRDGCRIIVAGTFAAVDGQAGATWAVMQYVLGLRGLGHDVWLLEPVPEVDITIRRSFESAVGEFDLRGRAALLPGDRSGPIGLSRAALDGALDTADLLINLSGVLRDPDLLGHVPRRAYVDLDPGFNQLWHAAGIDRGFDAHTHHFTVGLALGTPQCPIPLCGRRWTPILPPVVLALWPQATDPPSEPLSTVGNWRSYGPVVHNGVFYGQKAHSVRELIELPGRSDEALVMALAIHPGDGHDTAALRAHGWRLADPRRVAGTPGDYRSFIARSRGELGVAKAGYVTARCGWFSDRSACYLASGRPVIAQDTGLGAALPVGQGLLTFSGLDGALDAMRQLNAGYPEHAGAARQLAEDVLDSRVILSGLVEEVGAR